MGGRRSGQRAATEPTCGRLRLGSGGPGITAPPRRTRLASPFGAVYSQVSRDCAAGAGRPTAESAGSASPARRASPACPAPACVRAPDAGGRRARGWTTDESLATLAARDGAGQEGERGRGEPWVQVGGGAGGRWGGPWVWGPKAAARGPGPRMTVLAEPPAFAVNSRGLRAQRPVPGARGRARAAPPGTALCRPRPICPTRPAPARGPALEGETPAAAALAPPQSARGRDPDALRLPQWTKRGSVRSTGKRWPPPDGSRALLRPRAGGAALGAGHGWGAGSVVLVVRLEDDVLHGRGTPNPPQPRGSAEGRRPCSTAGHSVFLGRSNRTGFHTALAPRHSRAFISGKAQRGSSTSPALPESTHLPA